MCRYSNIGEQYVKYCPNVVAVAIVFVSWKCDVWHFFHNECLQNMFY